jgi:hypothetical protein
MTEPITSYREFWPYYLREHAKPKTRAVHFAGTVLATVALLAMIVTGRLWLIPAALALGYGPAWFSHFFIEKNRPATFTYPLWSLISDYRMALGWLSGELANDLSKAGIGR